MLGPKFNEPSRDIERIAEIGKVSEAEMSDLANFLEAIYLKCIVFDNNFFNTRSRQQSKEKLDALRSIGVAFRDELFLQLEDLSSLHWKKIGYDQFGGSLRDGDYEPYTKAVDAAVNELNAEARAVWSIIDRIDGIGKYLEAAPETEWERIRGCSNVKPVHKYLVTELFAFWTDVLNREPKVTKTLVAFADNVCRSIGLPMTESALSRQLDFARGLKERGRLPFPTSEPNAPFEVWGED
jgi:hypothetical protein